MKFAHSEKYLIKAQKSVDKKPFLEKIDKQVCGMKNLLERERIERSVNFGRRHCKSIRRR